MSDLINEDEYAREWARRRAAGADPLPPEPIVIPEESLQERMLAREFSRPRTPEPLLPESEGLATSLQAEELALEALVGAVNHSGGERALLLRSSEIYAQIAVARALREHTASLSAPPIAYRMNQTTGTFERLSESEKENQ